MKRDFDLHSTVGTVSPPPGLWGLVDNNVLDDQVLNSQVFRVGVGLGVFQEPEDESHRLCWPSSYNANASDTMSRFTQFPSSIQLTYLW